MSGALSLAVASARAEEVKLLAARHSARPFRAGPRRKARGRVWSGLQPAGAQVSPCR